MSVTLGTVSLALGATGAGAGVVAAVARPLWRIARRFDQMSVGFDQMSSDVAALKVQVPTGMGELRIALAELTAAHETHMTLDHARPPRQRRTSGV